MYSVIVLRYLQEFGMDVLELAVECQCEKFVSNLVVQKILDEIWKGKKNIDKINLVNIFF